MTGTDETVWSRHSTSSTGRQRRFGTLVGHVVPNGPERWTASLDGIIVGHFPTLEAAERAVEIEVES